MKILSAILVILVFSGCASNPKHNLSRPQKDDRTLKDVSQFFAAVSLADSVIVYEGLPHQIWAKTAYATEVKRLDVVWFEGYPFYATSLSVPQKELKKLTAIALRKEAHVRYSGFKMCAGYHPDYAVVWEKDGKKSGSLICLGCHEWKNFTSRGRIYEDLEPAAYGELREILSKYVVRRPTIKKADTKGIIGPSMPDINFNSPAMFVKFLSEKIAAEPDKPETGLYINYLASYLVLLAEKKNFDHEIFATLNRVAPAIAKLHVGSIIIPSGNSAWKSEIISDPHGALENRPFLSDYFYYFFDEAKKIKGNKIPDYTGPIYGNL